MASGFDTLALQADAQAILDRRLPLAVRSIFYLVALLVAVGVTWAALAEVDRVAVAQGKIITTERPIVVQPFERGIIRSIDVDIGSRVTRGQILAHLDPTLTSTSENDLVNRREQLAARVARLTAEMEGRTFTPSETRAVSDRTESRGDERLEGGGRSTRC